MRLIYTVNHSGIDIGLGRLGKQYFAGTLGLLILGLGGFGVTNLSGGLRTVGHVGDQAITVDDYYRELQREIRATEAQIGQSLTMEQVQMFGIDQRVLGRLVAMAALDDCITRVNKAPSDRKSSTERNPMVV